MSWKCDLNKKETLWIELLNSTSRHFSMSKWPTTVVQLCLGICAFDKISSLPWPLKSQLQKQCLTLPWWWIGICRSHLLMSIKISVTDFQTVQLKRSGLKESCLCFPLVVEDPPPFPSVVPTDRPPPPTTTLLGTPLVYCQAVDQLYCTAWETNCSRIGKGCLRNELSVLWGNKVESRTGHWDERDFC